MRRQILLALPTAFLFTPLALSAQHAVPPPPAAWAMEGVTVVDGNGQVREGMTLVIRDGVIRTLAPGATVPGDARRIQWDDGTLHVYPGFIDGDGFANVSVPAPDRDGIQAWNPTREVQDFTPHRVAADYLTVDGGDLTAYRRKGVVASLAFPGRGPVPGQVSAILHRPDARTSRELVLNPSVGVAMAFQGARGAYPGTMFGVHALIRQGFLDAQHHAARMAALGSDPGGMEVEVWDDDLRILEEVRTGSRRVFFRVDGAEDIRRVLSLSAEIGFTPVIVGGQEAGVVARQLAARNVPVLLSLNFPRPDQWTPGSEGDLSPAAHREKERLERIWSTAAVLHEAEVRFAFTSGGSSDTDLLAGVRRTVEYGLPAEAAVRALTLSPAELIGMPRMGRVAEGSAANLVITDGPITEEGTRVAWTFVNGRAERGADLRAGDAPDEADGPPVEIGGRWQVQIDAQGMALPVTMVIEQDGATFSGTMESDMMGSSQITNGVIRGNRLTFQIQIPGMGEGISASATVEEGRLQGTGSGPAEVGSFSFSGTRSPGTALLRGVDR
jgi:imidazolonepropionase-like amidohydrolase